jgi:hypothetical protein
MCNKYRIAIPGLIFWALFSVKMAKKSRSQPNLAPNLATLLINSSTLFIFVFFSFRNTGKNVLSVVTPSRENSLSRMTKSSALKITRQVVTIMIRLLSVSWI